MVSEGFKTELMNKAFIIQMPQSLSVELTRDLELQMKTWLLQQVDLFIFDFSHVKALMWKY